MDYSTFAFPKGGMIKEKKDKPKVSEATYNAVFKICKGKCAVCLSKLFLEYHHIYYRSERKDLIDEPKNGILLCNLCHGEAHNNKKKWQPYLLKLRKQLEKENKK
jgi:5-methylcytosine-specific restriction endonuclease McrA